MVDAMLTQMKPKFDEKHQGLSTKDKELKWNDIVDSAYTDTQSKAIKDNELVYQHFWEGRESKLSEFSKNLTNAQKSAIETMAEARYQKVKEVNVGPLSIDRVTLDGARDIVGDIHDKLRSGPFYDLNK